ncbi:MAG: tetratricopeptide repeat protein [Spirochaetes bacterium]|nr:tetratricopeptide repeat protein [Spirochaetota bacterium]
MLKRVAITTLCALCWFAPVFAVADNDRQFELATGAFKSRNYGSAELLFKRIIDSGDDEYRDKAWFYYARSIYHQKKYKSAIYEFNSYVNQSRTASLSTESRFWMGESYYRLRESAKAIEEYNRYISISKEDKFVPVAHDRIASIYFTQRRFDESIIEWNSAISKSKDRDRNAYRVYKIGEALFHEKKYEESLQRLYPLLTSRTRQRTVASAQLLIGRIYQKTNNHAKAIVMFQSIPEDQMKHKGIRDAQYFMALSEIKLKDYRKALTLLDIFTLMGKDSPWFYNAKYEMGRLLLETNDKAKGIEQLEEVRRMSRKEYLRINASKILSFVYIKQHPSKAIPYLEDALNTENTTRQKEILLLLARAYIKVRDFPKCEWVLTQYREKYPFDQNLDQVMFLQARIHLEKGEMTQAVKGLEAMEKEYPFSKYLTESKYYVALAQRRMGKTRESVGLLQEYLGSQGIKHPYGASLLLFRNHLKLNDLKSAEPVLSRIITKYIGKGETEKAVYEYAVALDSRGMNPWKYYNIIIGRYPKSGTAMRMYHRIGNSYFREKKYREAVVFFDKFLASSLKEDRGNAFFNRLQCLYYLKQYRELIGTLEKGNLPPMDESQWGQIPLLASRAHYNLDNYEEVYNNLYIDNLKKYSSDDLFMFARSAIAVGDVGTAQEIIKHLGHDSIHYKESLFLMAQHYRKTGDTQLAGEKYMSILSGNGQGQLADKVRVELAELRIQEKRYPEAMELLSRVKDTALSGSKNALLAMLYFKSGDPVKGAMTTQANLYKILGSPKGEEIVRLNIQYHYRKHNTQRFVQYTEYLKQYRGTTDYVNYITGRYYFDMRFFQNSITYFNRLGSSKGQYQAEANYMMGMIQLLHYKNMPLSLRYFLRACESVGPNPIYKWKSKINIAIIYHEMDDRGKAVETLKEVLDGVEGGAVWSQARNLTEYLQR